jgi:hypothetical protein
MSGFGEISAGIAAAAGLASALIGLWNQRKIGKARDSAEDAKTTVHSIDVKVDGRLSDMIELLRAGEQRAGQLASTLQAAGLAVPATLPVPPPLPPPPGGAPLPAGS